MTWSGEHATSGLAEGEPRVQSWRDRLNAQQAQQTRQFRREGASMAEITIHPAVDEGVKPGAKDFAGGTLRCHCATDPVEVRITGMRAQPRVRLHEVLEAEGGAVLAGGGRPARQGAGDQERRQAEGGRPERADPAPRLPRVRRAHARPGRARRNIPSPGWSSSTPSCRRNRAGRPPDFAAFVSSIIESGDRAREDGRDPRAAEGAGPAPYDWLSPGLMDYIATYTAKASGVLKD